MSIPRDNYVGKPDYPAPWTTRRPREGLRDLDEARVVSLSPDVCLTPIGSSVVPIPYPIVDYCGHDKDYTPSVFFTRKKAMVMRSRTTHVHGDAPGTKKGVKSGTVENVCEPIGHADQVRAEGSHVIRHLDRFWMNDRNTQGEAIFVRGTETYAPPEDDDPIPGSLRWNSSDEGKIMSDASPEPLVMGAQYADASGGALRQVAPQQQPAGNPQTRLSPTPRPGVGQPGNVIQGPWSPRPPPTLQTPTGFLPNLLRYGKYGVLVLPLMLSGDTPLIPYLPRDADPVEKELNERARSLLDPFEHGYNRDVQRWYNEQIEAYRRHKRSQEEQQQLPQPLPVPETVRVEQDREKRRCRVDTYKKMEPICKSIGMQAHHIVPDWTLRWGTREEGIVGSKRIDTMPGYWEGQSICVVGNARTSGTEHNESHLADGAIENIGATSNPLYTAALDDVKRESIIAMSAVRPDCVEQIVKAVNDEFANSNKNQRLRALQRVQDIPEETMKILSNGKYKK
ncbi:DUF4150 domain-containing protein [Rhizobium ruizarguesonis]|uniref:DUF4150 domain-containing protein n=1 Tax=Rhizobium ruizarguesonis TaxID=2081791 RepID=UPI00103148D7|nr:DUF4150 domain-containing protein [Rhizobium ruizarguesonis]TAW82249.1 DUF4150 domain-containing protein [Rhizobium ruizarguesonis]